MVKLHDFEKLIWGCNLKSLRRITMKKMLIAIAIMAFAVCAFGVANQTMGTAHDDIGVASDLQGEGEGDKAYVYAKFTLSGIGFQVTDNGTCTADASPGASNDVWILTAVGSNDDVSQTTPFEIENTGGVALDLGMYIFDESITSGDAWDYAAAFDTDISFTLNQFKLFGVFANEAWAPADEAAVASMIKTNTEFFIPEAVAWYLPAKYNPAGADEDVYSGKTHLNLAPACGVGAGSFALKDWCQLRLRLVVSEGASDMEAHAAQIALVSRVTLGD